MNDLIYDQHCRQVKKQFEKGTKGGRKQRGETGEILDNGSINRVGSILLHIPVNTQETGFSRQRTRIPCNLY